MNNNDRQLQPLAFKIRDFKSIVDSGECTLSSDGITVIAGQNESGKTAVLCALRDFDLPVGEKPLTPDYRPEGNFDARSEVSVKFRVDVDKLVEWLSEDKHHIPDWVLDAIREDEYIWITRDLGSGNYRLVKRLTELFDIEPERAEIPEKPSLTDVVNVISAAVKEYTALTAEQFAAYLRDYWPSFVYFDSFNGTLPRSVEYSLLQANPQATGSAPGSVRVPSSVEDFFTLSRIDLKRIESFANDDKNLGNYLDSCCAEITGDFLSYWKQVDAEETIRLRMRHNRDEQGRLQFAFYIYDKVDQYPEQRSKGLLWFLSFYLRLAASYCRDERARVLLIDEPGSYLHARAQKDVLRLFEDRLVEKDDIVYSTHSPYLIPPDKLHRLRVVVKTASHGTLIADKLTHPLLRKSEFSDSLSPVLSAVGLDISQALNFVRQKNIILEGISDYFYLSAWAQALAPEVNGEYNLFPATGAPSVVTLASLFIGWGLKFIVVLDHDQIGTAARDKLIKELAVDKNAIIQPRDAAGIEDLFSSNDFSDLLRALDSKLKISPNEAPTKAIKRQNIEKTLLARRYSELVSQGKATFSTKTEDNVRSLFRQVAAAWDIVEPSSNSKALAQPAGQS